MYYWSSEKATITSIKRIDNSHEFSTRRMIICVKLDCDDSYHTVNLVSAPTIQTDTLFFGNTAASLFPEFWNENRYGKIGQAVYYRHTADSNCGYLVPIII